MSLDCSVYWYWLLLIRPPTLMFWIIWKNTAMPVTLAGLAAQPLDHLVRAGRVPTSASSATSMRPWLAVELGPPTPTVELT